LNGERPLGLNTKPVAGLSGSLWNEMIEIERQSEPNKKKTLKKD
jgi:hypothetical protein